MPDEAITEIDQQIAEQTEGLPGDWTEIGWLPPTDLSRDDWLGIGPKLSGVFSAIHWWIGDWVVHGERTFGEMAAQAIDATDFEYNTISKDAWVARAIPYDQRRPELSYSHHRNLASSDINPTERAALMDMAIKNEWTTKMTLAFKIQWIQRREKLLLKAQGDGKLNQSSLPLPSVPALPDNPTVEQVMHHINRMEQERRAVSVDLPRKSYRRGTGFPQIYDQRTGELSSAWRGIWNSICDNCRDTFMEAERAAWVKEDESAEQE